EMIELLHEERGLREIHFSGYGPKPAVLLPGGEKAHRSRIARKRVIGESVNVKQGRPRVMHAHRSCRNARYRSISPMTMSILPTMAGTSAMRQPRQISLVT